MKTISEALHDRKLFSVSPRATVTEASRYLAENNIGALPVIDDTQLVGVFSERDVITRVIAKNLAPDQTKVEDVMTRRIVVADIREGHESCLKKMRQAHCRHLPIVDGEQIVGMISLRDLLTLQLDETEKSLEYLHSYIYTVPPGATKRYESNASDT